ncbi:MAG: helix-turn-helix transcriptional regulator [Eubacteriales bacterium]|nr:helix-turn-helix transcriptional regulator [Eubacteriales bacterium]
MQESNPAFVSFGERLREIRKEKGMSQQAFAQMLGTSKQVLSRYETGQRSPKISKVQQYAQKLGVSAEYLMEETAEEGALNALYEGGGQPFYKIFIDVTEKMGLNIPGIVRVTGLTDKQVRTIIMHRMKDAPLSVALRLSDTLNVPLEVWTGEQHYKPREISIEAYEVARAYDRASDKERSVARLALDLKLVK